MENPKVSPKQTILNYGLVLGLLAILIPIVQYALGYAYERHWAITVLSLGLMTALIVLGIKKYKEINGGFLSFVQGLKVGVGIAMISALVSIVYGLIFTNFIEPEFMNNILSLTEQGLRDNPNMTDEAIEQTLKITKLFMSPALSTGIQLIVAAFLGFIISLIASLAMQTKEQPY